MVMTRKSVELLRRVCVCARVCMRVWFYLVPFPTGKNYRYDLFPGVTRAGSLLLLHFYCCHYNHKPSPTQPGSDAEPPVPQPVQLAVDVLDRCRHHLGAPSPRVRMLVLEALRRGIFFLSPFERQLLPAVHDMWEPLLPLLGDANAPVAISALHLLENIASAAKDFVRARMSTDAVPRLAARLRTAANLAASGSSSGGSGSGVQGSAAGSKNYGSGLSSDSSKGGNVPHARSWAVKLVQATLKTLGTLALPAGLRGANLEAVVVAVVPLMHPNTGRETSQEAIELLQRLSHLDRDLVWFHVARVACVNIPNAVCTPSPPLNPMVLGPGQPELRLGAVSVLSHIAELDAETGLSFHAVA